MFFLRTISTIVFLLPFYFVPGQKNLLEVDDALFSDYERATITSFLQGDEIKLLDIYLIAGYEEALSKQNEWKSFNDYLASLKKKKEKIKSGENFLEYLFFKTHRRYLKHYDRSAAFNDLFGKGNYNCLSATAFYVLLLEKLDYDYTIRETEFHIYILIDTANDQYLLETTDPLAGFVNGKHLIQKRIYDYKANITGQGSEKERYYRFNARVDNCVSKYQLAGLLYYNEAINYYNERKFEKCLDTLSKSLLFYNSERINEFYGLALKTFQNSRGFSKTKSKHVNNYISLK